MKILKIVGIGLLLIVGTFLLIGVFLPSSVSVERSLVMNAPAEVIFEQINDLEKWEAWSPWKANDPEMKITYGEKTKGLGASYSWESETQGSGTLTVSKSEPNTLQENHLVFVGMGESDGFFKLEEADEGVKVTWGFTSDVGWSIIGRYFNLMMDGMVGPDFESGLGKLKTIVESAPAEQEEPETTDAAVDDGSPQVILSDGFNALTMRGETSLDQIGAKLGEFYGTLMTEVGDPSQMAGMPFAMYHNFDEASGVVDLEAGLPLNDIPAELPEGIEGKYFEPMTCVKYNHYGDYHKIRESYEVIKEYRKENGLTAYDDVTPWEVYITDPTTEPDTSKWLTEIYFPIWEPVADSIQ